MTPISRGCQLQVDKYVASHDGIATDRCKTRWSNVWCHSHGAPKLITHTPATTTGSVAIMISSGAVARRKAPTRSPWAFFQFAISDFTNKVARAPSYTSRMSWRATGHHAVLNSPFHCG